MDQQAISVAERAHDRRAAEPASQSTSAPAFADHRPGVVVLRKLAETMNDSPRVAAQRKLADAMHDSPRMVAQRALINRSPAEPAQLQDMPEEEELLQGKFEPVQRAQPEINSSARDNNTGLPDQLKAGIESLSGMSLDNVNVHYNSSQPAQLNALAYAQGNNIHVASGQEQHLPHEVWHVVQQAQGRVQPTMQMQDVPINDDEDLENEADVMGMQAKQLSSETAAQLQPISHRLSADKPIQRAVPMGGETEKPVPDAGSYRARGGQNTIFDAELHPRSKFSFGSNTRTEVFEQFNPQRVGNRIVSVRATNGEQMNVEGLQLDHERSWDNIARVMTEHNRALKETGEEDMDAFYTLWDAKMYYNDQPNLQPAPGGLNAAAGTEGVTATSETHYGLQAVQGELQTTWMNLQAGLTAVGEGVSEETALEVAELMWNVMRAMNDVTERLL